MNPRHLHGRILALILGRDINGDDLISVGIRWRVYGYGGGALWLRSVDGNVRSKLSFAEFELLVDQHRLRVYHTDPLPDLLERYKRRETS